MFVIRFLLYIFVREYKAYLSFEYQIILCIKVIIIRFMLKRVGNKYSYHT